LLKVTQNLATLIDPLDPGCDGFGRKLTEAEKLALIVDYQLEGDPPENDGRPSEQKARDIAKEIGRWKNYAP
jgi:hypothetical protein